MSNIRKYQYDENYFDNIDSYEKAYWLGFIMADGYIMNNLSKNNKSDCNGLRIRLVEDDKSHLEKFNNDIKSNKPIKIVKNYGKYKGCKNLCEFSLYSRPIMRSLINLGLSAGNKSCNENFIEFEDKNLTKNFILGLFDGDGSVTIYNSYSKRDNKYRKLPEWSIMSSYEMVVKIKEFLEKEIPNIKFQKLSSDHRCDNLYRLKIGNRNSIKNLYEYFYFNNCSKSYLDRKHDKMKEIYDNL